MGQLLRWRYARGAAPAVEPHIVHVDVTLADLRRMPSLEEEAQQVAKIIRMATDFGARVIAFDSIYGRGSEQVTAPILAEVKRAEEQGRSVVFAETLMPSTETGELERLRSFPQLPRRGLAGLINIHPDADGVLRQYELVQRLGPKPEPSLALAAYMAWRDVKWDEGVTFPTANSARWVELSEDFTTEKARTLSIEPTLLNMRTPWTSPAPPAFLHFTVAQLEEKYTHRDPSAARPLEGAIVFVGYTSASISDLGTNVMGPSQPRVLLHSSALSDMIQERQLRRTPRWADLAAVGVVLLLGCGAAFCRHTVSLIGLWLAALLLLAAGSATLLFYHGWLAAAMLTIVLWTVWIVAEMARRYSSELVRRQRLRATMSMYFSPRVMQRVLANPGCMDPQEVEVTALLTDLRNSTPIAEVAGAHGTFALLNQVFEAQTEAIVGEDGSLEHFLGDQFLSYWGAPDAQPDAADRAVRGAQKLIVGMEKVREKLSPEIRALFGYGVALHSGKALLGNKGSAKRLDYGLVGDLINAAARIEALTKSYGVLFLISRETFNKLSAPPPSRVLDEVIVKGKSTSLELLELKHAFSPANFEAVAIEYAKAYALYQKGEFTAAQQLFAQLAEQGDRPSKLMVERCRELLETPPVNWHGVYEMKTK